MGQLPFEAQYVDDILIWSSSATDHLEHLKIIVQLLKNAGIIELKKCNFERKLNFWLFFDTIGNICQSIMYSSYKIFSEIGEYKTSHVIFEYTYLWPKICWEICSSNYYTNQIITKSVRWNWTEEKAFQNIKEAYSKVTFLKHPVCSKRFYFIPIF